MLNVAQVEIHTDPKACEYVIVRGAERKIEARANTHANVRFSHASPESHAHALYTQEYSAADAETVALPDASEREAARADPFRRLEGAAADAAHARAAAPSLAQLEARSAATSRDDYTANKALRRAMRAQRGAAAAADAERSALGLPAHIPLLGPDAADAAAAAAVRFTAAGGGFDARRAEQRAALRGASVFAATGGDKRARAAALMPPPGGDAHAALRAKRRSMEAAGVRFGSSGGGGGGARADVFGGALRGAGAALHPTRRST
jgi:coiled-coil domain-containing protein 130